MASSPEMDEALSQAKARAEERNAVREASVRRMVRMGLSVKDVASSLGCSLETARRAVARAKAEE